METIEYRLGTEELVAALVALGRFEEAKKMLVGAFGRLEPEEEKGRLLSASHSLLARRLLKPVDGKLQVDEGLTQALRVLLESRLLIRAGRSEPGGEKVLTYYGHTAGWLEYAITDTVAHRLYFPLASQALEARLVDFFSPIFSPSPSPARIIFAASLFAPLPSGVSPASETLLAGMRDADFAPAEAKQFAEDFSQSAWRGSLVRMDQRVADHLRTTGTLYLQGPENLWKIHSISAGEMQASFCSQADFLRRIGELVEPGASPQAGG